MNSLESPDPPRTFEERTLQAFRETADRMFLDVPELRGVVVTFDWYGALNDAPGVSKGLWLTANHNQKSPDATLGALGVLIQNTAHVLDEAMKQHAALVSETTRLLQALRDAAQPQG